MSPTVLLYAIDPSFFERRDTWFNRRGVDVFCAMDMPEMCAILDHRGANLLLSRGVPGDLPAHELRELIPPAMPVLILAVESDDPALLASYAADPSVRVLRPPYEDNVMIATAEALKVPVRHYLRILVQLKIGEGSGAAFGFSNNVSASGMLLETKRRLPVGHEMDLSFMIPGAPQMTLVRARVVREANSPKPGVYRYGAQFLSLSDADRERIRLLTTRDDPSQSPPALPA